MCRNILGQLTQVQSLFTYGENESVGTFARPDFVPMFSDNITWSDNSVRLAAEAQCGNDYECLFDVASTNDLSVGIVTKDTVAQLVNESNVLGKSVVNKAIIAGREGDNNLFVCPSACFTFWLGWLAFENYDYGW